MFDEADKLFSQFIRLRDGKCMRCGTMVLKNEQGLPISHQASHFKGRRKEATRYEPLNVDCLCNSCHAYFTANPNEHEKWQVERKGQETVDMLIRLANSYKKKDRTKEKKIWHNRLKELLT